MLVYKANALLGGLRRYHHNTTQVVAVGKRLYHLQIVGKRKVGDDESRDTALHTTLAETLVAVVHNDVEITHQHKRYMYLVLYSLKLCEEVFEGHAVLQGYGSGTLYHRSVCQGVAKGYAHLYHVDALAL